MQNTNIIASYIKCFITKMFRQFLNVKHDKTEKRKTFDIFLHLRVNPYLHRTAISAHSQIFNQRQTATLMVASGGTGICCCLQISMLLCYYKRMANSAIRGSLRRRDARTMTSFPAEVRARRAGAGSGRSRRGSVDVCGLLTTTLLGTPRSTE